MKGLRVPMFVKFLVGCLALAAFLIIGSTYVFEQETQLRARGNFLAKAVRRLTGYTERVGRGMTGQLEMLATDGELRRAFAPPRAAPTDPKAPTPEPEVHTDPATIAQKMHDVLQSRLAFCPITTA